MAARPKAPTKDFTAFATAAPEDAAAVEEAVAEPVVPEDAAEPETDIFDAEADLALLAALMLELALALAAPSLGVGVAIAVHVSLCPTALSHNAHHYQRPSR